MLNQQAIDILLFINQKKIYKKHEQKFQPG